MGQPTLAQKNRMIRYNQDGLSYTDISRRFAEEGFSINMHSVRRILLRYKDTGLVGRGPRKRRTGKITVKQRQDIFEYYENTDNWEISTKDMFKHLRKVLNLTVEYTAFLRTKISFGVGTAPIRFVPLIREKNKPEREKFAKARLDGEDPLDKYIFVDESSVQTHSNKRIASFRIRRDEFFRIISRLVYNCTYVY